MCFVRPLILLVVLLSACGRQETRPIADTPDRRSSSPKNIGTANAVLFRAMSLVGTPYRYGGNTPQSGFDCSGLVGYVFRDAAGISLPRTSAALGELEASDVHLKNLASADLVLFAARRQISHVGIYVGNGQFVHAPNKGGTVRLDRLDAPGWKETFKTGKRIID